jgi:hypothetical protein
MTRTLFVVMLPELSQAIQIICENISVSRGKAVVLEGRDHSQCGDPLAFRRPIRSSNV